MTGAIYIDVNDGLLSKAFSSENGVRETLSFRFVAPDAPVMLRIIANALPAVEKVIVPQSAVSILTQSP